MERKVQYEHYSIECTLILRKYVCLLDLFTTFRAAPGCFAANLKIVLIASTHTIPTYFMNHMQACSVLQAKQ